MEVVGQLQSRQSEGKVQFGVISPKQNSQANQILLEHPLKHGLTGPQSTESVTNGRPSNSVL